MTAVLAAVAAAACTAQVDALAASHSGGTTGAAGGSPGESGDAAYVLQMPDGGADAPPPTDAIMTCAEQSATAKQVPVDILFVLDGSSSMGTEIGGKSKWAMARDATLAFARDARSSGLGLGMQVFPLPGSGTYCTSNPDCGDEPGYPNPCKPVRMCEGTPDATGALVRCTDTCPGGARCVAGGRCSQSALDCTNVDQPCQSDLPGDMCRGLGSQCDSGGSGSCKSAVTYETPASPIAELPVPAARLIARALERRGPGGATPLAEASGGALAYLQRYLGAHPGHKGLLVLSTDGVPGCGSPQPIGATVDVLKRAHDAGISTYVVGIVDAKEDRAPFDQLAVAGGTGMPFIITTANNFQESFLATLNEIRGAALPCEFGIPAPSMGTIDFGKVNLRLSHGAVGEDILYTGGASNCGKGGWYYDVAPTSGTPAHVLVCPTTCQRFKADAGATVELRFGCATRYVD